MDMTGVAYAFLAVLFVVSVILLFWKLDRIRPGGELISGVAFVLFVLSFLPDENSREISLVFGLFRLTGITGVVVGVVAALRHKARSRNTSDIQAIEAKSTPKVQGSSSKCRQCGLVNRIIDSSCKRCGADL